MRTTITTNGIDFLINGRPTYTEIDGSHESAHGLLFNARFIQGIFDDKADPERFARYGFDRWDPEDHTDRLIAALPQWYDHGLRAFTVGVQGGGPCFTIDNRTIDNNPFGSDGTVLDPAYAGRLDRLIRAADAVGMAVIVSYFYASQAERLADGRAVRNAVTTASRFLREGGYTNVIIEVANEMNIPPFRKHPIIQEPEGMSALLDLAREQSGGMLVGCSGGGGYAAREVVESSDVVLIHGNGQSRQKYYNLIRTCREWAPDKPIVCNEDSQAIGQLGVATETHTSWGYYNNMTKQEPPAYWSILPGEDTFFARRMAQIVGIQLSDLTPEQQYYLQGFEPHMTYEGKRWVRLASMRPETIDRVRFFRNGSLYWTAYDEPFAVHFNSNWNQGPVHVSGKEEWIAEISLTTGDKIERRATAV
jgi:hypothetical protein